MKKSDTLIMPRRQFIASASFLMLGGSLWDRPAASSRNSQTVPLLKEELTPEELKIVKGSVMAQNLGDYFETDFSCAESIFSVSLKFLKKSKKLVWIASGFGGGLGNGDLCGFLTGGAMAIGLKSGMLKEKRWYAKEVCALKVDEYWKSWTSIAPLHCSEIWGEKRNPKVCLRLGQLASAKLEQLLESD
jgi:C_GCAxxG_C_C family probable redox protein